MEAQKPSKQANFISNFDQQSLNFDSNLTYALMPYEIALKGPTGNRKKATGREQETGVLVGRRPRAEQGQRVF